MNIYIGKKLDEIKSVVPQGTLVFEERFKKFTYMEYDECWKGMEGVHTIICKTRDAVLAAPAHANVIRVGRSIRISDKGQIIETSMTLENFKLLEL